MFGAVGGDFEAFLRWGENPPGAKTRDTLHTDILLYTFARDRRHTKYGPRQEVKEVGELPRLILSGPM